MHHGHWVERPDGTQILSKMVMHGTVELMTEVQWYAVEDQLSPVEERRRIREKTALPQVRMRKGKKKEAGDRQEEFGEAADHHEEFEELEEEPRERIEEQEDQG